MFLSVLPMTMTDRGGEGGGGGGGREGTEQQSHKCPPRCHVGISRGMYVGLYRDKVLGVSRGFYPSVASPTARSCFEVTALESPLSR